MALFGIRRGITVRMNKKKGLPVLLALFRRGESPKGKGHQGKKKTNKKPTKQKTPPSLLCFVLHNAFKGSTRWQMDCLQCNFCLRSCSESLPCSYSLPRCEQETAGCTYTAGIHKQVHLIYGFYLTYGLCLPAFPASV